MNRLLFLRMDALAAMAKKNCTININAKTDDCRFTFLYSTNLQFHSTSYAINLETLS